jgi:hypothetical protein
MIARLAALYNREYSPCAVDLSGIPIGTIKGCPPCTSVDLSGAFVGNTINSPVPQSSSRLQSNALNCALQGRTVNGPVFGVPESLRTAKLQQRTIDLSVDPVNPDARFSMYRTPFIQICPPIPQFYYTAGEPVLQGKNCALPNKPDNPVLPG